MIDAASAAQMERMIRVLQAASGDVVVVATVPTIEPYGDIREYAVKMFENHGRGIGQKGKNNGLLILLAMKERKVWVEVGYDLEEWITDGYAGETSRQYMTPEFRNGRYGAGLAGGHRTHHRPHRAGTQRHARRRPRPERHGSTAADRRRSGCRSDLHHHPDPQPHRRRPRPARQVHGRHGRLVERRRAVRRRVWRGRRRRRFGGGFGGFGGGSSGGGGGGSSW